MLDSKVLCDKLVLSANIVVERAFRKWPKMRLVRWRRGLAVSEECRYDDKVLLRIQDFIFSDKPEVVGYHLLKVSITDMCGFLCQSLHTPGIPCGVDNCGGAWVSKRLVRKMRIRYLLPTLKFPVSQLEGLVILVSHVGHQAEEARSEKEL